MDRRAFIGTLAGGLLVAPLAAEAQPTEKVARIGFLQRQRNENVTAFTQGLQEAGYVESRNLALEIRIYGGKEDTLPRLAAELVFLKCDVIVAASPYAITAAWNATRTVPIVGVDLESDPVANGWARSLSQPGGNVMGEFLDLPELGGKQIQLLREVVPEVARVAVLWDATIGQVQVRATEAAARTARVQAQSLGMRLAADLPEAFARAVRAHAQGMIVLSSPILLGLREEISKLALTHHLPAISLFTSYPPAGALMAYGPNLAEMYKRLAIYVDRILKGERPSDLPIARPTRFDLVINLKTAKALGLTIPPSLLQRADQVIE